MCSFDFVAYQRVVCERSGRASRETLPVDALLKELTQFAEAAEKNIKLHSGDRSLIDCGPGCSTCCVVNVSSLLPEGFAIARHIRGQGAAKVEKSLARLETLWGEVRGLDDEDRLYVRRPCAFLDDQGSCSIYPVRPLLCRSVSSVAAQDCRDALTARIFGEEKTILMNEFQQQFYESLFSGFAQGLEGAGLDGRSFQLAGLIRYLLRYPEAEQEWLDGRRLTWQDIY